MKRFLKAFSGLVLVLACALPGYAADSVWTKDPSAWHVEIYPVFAWAPFMGASVNLPQFPNLPNVPDPPNSGAGPKYTTSSSLNGAIFAALRVEKSKWSVSASGMWAGLSADASNPNVTIGLDVIFGQGMVGREIIPGLFVEGGVRRMALDISAKVLTFPEVSRKPGVWDPLVGLTYRKLIGKGLRWQLHGDGGGFGVGSDVTIAATTQLDWRFARHFGVTAGYGVLHFKESSTVLQRNLTIDQTMHGPIAGLGLFF